MTVFGLVAAAMASAVSAGMAVVAAAMLAVRALQPVNPPAAGAAGTPDTGLFYLIVLGTLAGLLVAAAVAWVLLAPVGSTYRQGGLAVVSAFATFLGMLVSVPVYGRFGKPGLATLLALCAVVAIGFARKARRVAASFDMGAASTPGA